MPQELKQERPHPGACAWWAPSVERAKKPNETFRASRPEGQAAGMGALTTRNPRANLISGTYHSDERPGPDAPPRR